MKLIYIQDDFLDPKLCQPFLELYDKKTYNDPRFAGSPNTITT